LKAELLEQCQAVLDAIEFPLSNLPKAWARRAPKVALALARVDPDGDLSQARGWGTPSIGIQGSRELIGVLNRDWEENVSSGSYDEIRRRCVKFLVEAGVALKDPDNANRAPNSPATGYALSEHFATLLRAYGTDQWSAALADFKSVSGSLRERFRQERTMALVPLRLPDGTLLELSPGDHNILQAKIIDGFLPRYSPGAEIIYVADALARQLYKNNELLTELGLFALDHRQLPDVIAYDRAKGWVLIIEAVATSGHLSPLRMVELKRLLEGCQKPQVFVTAFPNYAVFSRFADDIAWETEVWIADHPTHLIHYDGERYLGPYA
jgi:type II restriction enzyme